MTITTRIAALAAPLLMLGYGICRVLDGRDGSHGPGIAWNVGHTFFFTAFLAFGALVVSLRHGIGAGSPRRTLITNVAAGAGVVGVLAFLRVIIDDLFSGAEDVLPLPDVVQAVAPLLFLIGLFTLLVDVAMNAPHRLPWWSPGVVLLGFIAIMANVDLLLIAASLFLAGLAPLTRSPELELVRS